MCIGNVVLQEVHHQYTALRITMFLLHTDVNRFSRNQLLGTGQNSSTVRWPSSLFPLEMLWVGLLHAPGNWAHDVGISGMRWFPVLAMIDWARSESGSACRCVGHCCAQSKILAAKCML